MEETISDLTQWLENQGLESAKAEKISKSIKDEYWVTTVEGLRRSPQIFDALDLPLPLLKILKNKLANFSNKNLETLTTEEVQQLLKTSFPQQDYHNLIVLHQINGFVMNAVPDRDNLMSWGIKSVIHADALMQNINTWKLTGVPIALLTSKEAQASQNVSLQFQNLSLLFPSDFHTVMCHHHPVGAIIKPAYQ